MEQSLHDWYPAIAPSGLFAVADEPQLLDLHSRIRDAACAGRHRLCADGR
jgi:hypothetical protein